MSAACRDFRRRLEGALLGRSDPGELAALAWQSHLRSCADCRELLEAEQVLEELLATLPEPRLAPAAQQRLVARLRALREDDAALDSLLELDRVDPPSHLADAVVASVRGASHDPLDRALDTWRADAPAGLAERTLAALEAARAPAPAPTTPGRVLSFPVRVALAAAALLLAPLLWRLLQADDPRAPARGDDTAVAQAAPTPGADIDPVATLEAPSDELLANLDVLEAWDVLVDADVDLLLATYDPADEVLLEWTGDAGGDPETGGEAAATTPEEG